MSIIGIVCAAVWGVILMLYAVLLELYPKLRFKYRAVRARCCLKEIDQEITWTDASNVRLIFKVKIVDPEHLAGQHYDAHYRPPPFQASPFQVKEFYMTPVDVCAIKAAYRPGNIYECWVDVDRGVCSMIRAPELTFGMTMLLLSIVVFSFVACVLSGESTYTTP